MKVCFILLLLSAFCCGHSLRPLPALADGTMLPQHNGYMIGWQADIRPGVPMSEMNRVAQVWI